MTFDEFMGQKYAEAAEYSAGVTREQLDIARDAWEVATLIERKACLALAMEYAKSQRIGVEWAIVDAIRARSANA